ncbi:LOW QUALITY PROTEIN: uncharacterized protein J5F26_016032 [Ciconia maguari]
MNLTLNSSRLNGNGLLKEDPSTVGVTLKRPSSAPPTACVQNWAIPRPSITDASKNEKIATSMHNKLPARQTVSQPDCLSSTVENEDQSKPVPSSTVTNASAAEPTSNASTMSVATNVSKQEVPDEIVVEPAVNGNPKLSSDNAVPYGAESSGKSEESKGLFKSNCNIIPSNGILIGKVVRNCNIIPSNGILIGKVVRTLQNSHSSCQNAEEERSQHELTKNDSLNGAISLDNESKENGRKLDDSTCQVQPVKPSEVFFPKTNGLLETMPIALSPLLQEISLESLTCSLNSLSGEVRAPGPQKSSEHDARMETVVMEALFAYEESRRVPSNFSCEVENLFTPSGSETVSAKEEVAESIVTEVDNAHPNINGQHKVRRKSWDTEDEFLGQCESEDSRDKEKPRKSKEPEPELISTENPLSTKGSPESKETLGQASSMKSDMGCISQNLAPLEITDKCQDTEDISNNDVEEPPVNDSSITKLDKGLESQRKSSHCDKDFDKSSQAYSNRSHHKDFHCKSRWPHNALSRGEDVHRFSSHRANLHHCSVPQQQSAKYSRDRHALPPVSAHSNFEDSSRENEKLRKGKRKYSHTGSGSEIVKCQKIGDQRMKQYKKVKKKKKSKGKHREKDYKLYHLDFSVLHFCNDNRKRKKKKKKKKHIGKLKGFLEYLGPHFQKKTREKKEESCPPGGNLCEQHT